MSKFIALVALAILAFIAVATASYNAKHNDLSFEAWLLQHPKDYSNPEANSFDPFHFELRRQIYLSNLDTIRAHNERFERGLETWWMRPTQFADLTTQEFEAKHLGLAKGTQTDGSAAKRRLSALKPKSLKITNFEPIDWKKAGIMPAPVSQGSCGSCWANAAATVLTARINQQYGAKATNYVSRQQLTSCTPNPLECGGTGGCEGSTAQLAYDHLIGSGVVTEQDYPYISGHTQKTEKCAESGYNPSYTITGYQEVIPNDRQELFNALKKGPVTLSVYASNWSLYGGGIYTKCAGYEINHVVSGAGVGVDNGVYYYLVENSWGGNASAAALSGDKDALGWGEDGYIRVYMSPPDQDEKCGKILSPYDGSGCAKSPEPPRDWGCGCDGLLFDTAFPVGIQKL